MKRILLTLQILLFAVILQAQNLPNPMKPSRLVNDFSELFSNSERNMLEQKLRNYNDTTSTQIVVITVNSLLGYSSSDYAQRIAVKWGIGQKGKDNGVILLIKPQTANERGRIAISTGYGTEGYLTDALSTRIINKIIIPAFKENKYYLGTDRATTAIMTVLSGQYKASKQKNSGGLIWKAILMLLIIIFVFKLNSKNNSYTIDGRRNPGSGGGFLLGMLLGGLMGGGSGSGSSNSGGFGGGDFGGGGFGGFGGGDFGGGGASGSW